MAIAIASVNDECVFALLLERLYPERQVDAESVTRDAVALVTALEGQQAARFILQTVARPSPDLARGALEISLIVVLEPTESAVSVDDRLAELLDDLLDLLSAPPLRWIFRPVESLSELEAILTPIMPTRVAVCAH